MHKLLLLENNFPQSSRYYVRCASKHNGQVEVQGFPAPSGPFE